MIKGDLTNISMSLLVFNMTPSLATFGGKDQLFGSLIPTVNVSVSGAREPEKLNK